MGQWIVVGKTADTPPGSFFRFDAEEGLAIAVFNVRGQYYALEDLCTHEDEELTAGKFCGEEISCWRHGARFNVKTGAALCAPAYEPVATFPVRVTDGQIEVELPG
jgi:3-phenylpropionate/trans-cinnamate dioxygenase ferredoxin subunit